jgi:hypothetical protein
MKKHCWYFTFWMIFFQISLSEAITTTSNLWRDIDIFSTAIGLLGMVYYFNKTLKE